MRVPSVIEAEENRRCVDAALERYGRARMRVVVSVYGPGDDGPRYWTLLGESGSVELRSADEVESFLAALRDLLAEER